MRRRTAALAVLAALLAAGVPLAWSGAFTSSAHGGRSMLPRRCGSCHIGHGKPQTTMMPGNKEMTCLICFRSWWIQMRLDFIEKMKQNFSLYKVVGRLFLRNKNL